MSFFFWYYMNIEGNFLSKADRGELGANPSMARIRFGILKKTPNLITKFLNSWTKKSIF